MMSIKPCDFTKYVFPLQGLKWIQQQSGVAIATKHLNNDIKQGLYQCIQLH